MRNLLILVLLSAFCCAQSPITGQQVVVTGSGSIFVFVANVIIVLPNTIGAAAGTTIPFTAQFIDKLENNAPACPSAGWASSSPSTATINAATGVATTVAPGTTTISCTAAGLVGNATLTVESAPNFTSPALPCANPCPLVTGQVGVAYSYQLAAGGGTPPYIFSLLSGTLPSGINCTSAGLCSGTPTTAGTSLFTFQVCDTLPLCASLTMSIVIAASGSMPDYTPARTDLTAVTWPSVPPQMGPNTCSALNLYACGNLTGVGTCATDADFGYQVCRVTDITTPRPVVHYKSMSVAASGSSDENRWNPNSTILNIDDWGGATELLNIVDNGTTITSSRRYASDPLWSAFGGFYFTGVGFWSRNVSTPYILYNVPASGTKLQHWDVSNPTVAPTGTTTDLDFAACLAAASGQNPFIPTWNSNGGGNRDDTAFSIGFSNSGGQQQDGARYIAVYVKGSGCRVLNTATLTVTGDFGPTGAITGTTCTVGRIHNLKIMKASGSSSNGAVLVSLNTPSGGSACPDAHNSPMVWFYNSLTFQPICPGVQCSGHWTSSETLWMNNPQNNPPTCFFAIRQALTPTSVTCLNPSLPTPSIPPGWDMHFGWNGPLDTFPIFGASGCCSNGVTSTPNGAWQNEVMGFWPYTSNPMRFAKTMNSPGNWEFSTQWAMASGSQDGKYVAYSGDWLGTLGSETADVNGQNIICTAGTGAGATWTSGGAQNTLGKLASFAINNPGMYVYKVTTTGTSGTVRPSWNQTVGSITIDGTVQWTNMGPRCRGDVFVVRVANKGP